MPATIPARTSRPWVSSHPIRRIFERFLSELAQFREVLIQHLDLLTQETGSSSGNL
jgi:hypothetical protein